MTRLKTCQERQSARKKTDLENATAPAVTTDGYPIEVVANIAGLSDAVNGVLLGGEGIGLLCTEFLFQDRDTAPNEEEQYQA